MNKIIMCILTFIALTISVNSYNSSYLDSANNLAKKWHIKFQPTSDKYNLDSNVLRQEIALISRRVSGIKEKSYCDEIFQDVWISKPNTWACKNIEALVDANLISRNLNFRPEDNISKSESLIMFIRSIWFDFEIDDKSSDSWQKQVVEYAASKWVVDNFTDYNSFATRWFVFQIADFSIKVKEKEKKEEIEKKETKKYSDE